MKRNDEEDPSQELIEFEKNDEELLDMGNMDKKIPIESSSKCDYLFMDWVDTYITKIEDQ